MKFINTRPKLQGNYTITNFILPDISVPFDFKVEGRSKGRFTGKFVGDKLMTHMFSYIGYGRVAIEG